MDIFLSLAVIATIGFAVYRYGKRIGSRKGFGAGLRKGRRRRR